MDYGMIGKIEKAKRYAQQPERMTFLSLAVEFKGDNSTYNLHLGPEGWDCSCSGFRTHGMCPHVMTMEKLFKPMIKRSPLPYAAGQNVVSDVEKAMRYAEEPDRIQFKSFEVTFDGDNSAAPHCLSVITAGHATAPSSPVAASAATQWRWSASSRG